MTNFNKERFGMSIQCNRMARDCLSTALRYAHDRETFGKPLVANQIIRHKIATLARGVEAHWAWLEQIAYHIQNSTEGWNGQDVAGRVALSKVTGGRLLEKAAREAQQILGGAGYQRGGVGARVEQISRDLRMMVVGGGSEEILEDLAVKLEIMNAARKGWKL
jgi:alkylation response protein AidB-like acyl-CoA dehydrogenase